MLKKLVTFNIALAINFTAMYNGFAVEDKSEQLNYKLSRLGVEPDWSSLDRYQHSITRKEFEKLLRQVYSEGESYMKTIRIFEDYAKITKKYNDPSEVYVLKFKKYGTKFKRIERYYKPVWKMPIVDERNILVGVHIAIDPGHIGGIYAKMEERWFKKSKGTPVKEGDMTLLVSKILKKKLEKDGAKVTLLRENLLPLTKKRPNDFMKLAKKIFLEQDPMYVDKSQVHENEKIIELPKSVDATLDYSVDGILDGDARVKSSSGFEKKILNNGSNRNKNILVSNNDHRKIVKLAEKFFYRVSEIRERGKLINETIKPDLVLCIHFNAEAWGDPENTVFSQENHVHFLVNGCYSKSEFAYDDMRLDLLERILQRTYYYELSLAESISKTFMHTSNLPAFIYRGNNAKSVNGNKYIWARNLIANRLYKCPVVYCEPYVMNNEEVYTRIQAGQYEGEKSVAGKMRVNIFEEYASALYEGVISYYKKYRPNKVSQ